MNAKLRGGFWVVWSGIAVIGAVGVVERLLDGHQDSANGSYIPWGLWVSAYIYFIGLSAGAFLLSSLVYVFGVTRLERIGKLSLFVAVVTLLMALGAIWMDLGRMERFYRVFTEPNFDSMMTWMVWLYTCYFFLLVAELWFALRGDLARWTDADGPRGRIARALAFSPGPLTPRQELDARAWLRVLGAIGIPLTIAFNGGVAALFGAIAARPYWHTPLLPILFLTGALVSGAALLAFVVAVFWPSHGAEYRDTLVLLGRVVLALLLFDVMLEWAEFSIPMWYGVGRELDLMNTVLFGEFWWVFWILHVLLGTLIPVALLVAKRTEAWAVGLAGFLVAATFMTVRLNIVVPGLIEPNLQALETAFVDPRLVFSYVPSLFEWQVTLFIVAIGAGLFYLGYRYLPITEEVKASWKAS